MNGFRAVFKRELKGYFATPVAYVFLVIFLFVAGYWTFRDGFFQMRQADMTIFFNNLPWLFVIMIPAREASRCGSTASMLTRPRLSDGISTTSNPAM